MKSFPSGLPTPTVAAAISRSVNGPAPEQLRAPAHASPYELRTVVIPGGRLATHVGAVLRDDAVVFESVRDEHLWQRLTDASTLGRLGAATRLRGRYASVITAWSHGYYHWLLEALPRIAVLRASGVEVDGLIVPERLSEFHLASLERLGFARGQLVPYTGEHVVVDELVWPAPLAPVGRPTSASTTWLAEAMGPTEASGHGARIYLRRTRSRGVSNEQALLGTLAQYDVRPVDADQCSFDELMSIFAGASLVIGPHGAGFANSVFSPELVAVEIYQSSHLNSSTLCAAAAAGHEHWHLIGRRAIGPHRPRNLGVRVPLDQLKATLEATS